jgi:uncharacterized protein (DUF983 family)
MGKYQYFWTCPKCRTKLELKMRVTQGSRRCPECGTAITTREIDKQRFLSVLATALLVFGGLIWLRSGFWAALVLFSIAFLLVVWISERLYGPSSDKPPHG